MKYLAIAVVAACAIAPASADPARYHAYWKQAVDYATAGFAEADKATAAMKTDHNEYCYRLAMTRTELERSTKLFMYAFEQMDADATLTEAEVAQLEPMIDDYKSIKGIQDRYIALQETRCLAGPSYSDTLPSTSYSDDGEDEDDDDFWDEYDPSEEDDY